MWISNFGNGVSVEETFPYPLPDLFAGEQLVVAGRYRDGGTVDVELSGDVNGKSRLYVYPGPVLGDTRWEKPSWQDYGPHARSAPCLEQIRRSGADEEVIDAIVDLSLRYGIVTPYTSYLVEEPAVAIPGAWP